MTRDLKSKRRSTDRMHHRRSTTLSDLHHQATRRQNSNFTYCCFGTAQTKTGILFVTPLELFLWASSATYFTYLILIHRFEHVCEFIMQEASSYIPCSKVAIFLTVLFAVRGLALLFLFYAMRTKSGNCILFVMIDLTLRLGLQLALCLLLTIVIVCRREWLDRRPYLERLIGLWLLTCKDMGVFCLMVAYYRFISEAQEWDQDIEYEALVSMENIKIRGGMLRRMTKVMSFESVVVDKREMSQRDSSDSGLSPRQDENANQKSKKNVGERRITITENYGLSDYARKAMVGRSLQYSNSL